MQSKVRAQFSSRLSGRNGAALGLEEGKVLPSEEETFPRREAADPLQPSQGLGRWTPRVRSGSARAPLPWCGSGSGLLVRLLPEAERGGEGNLRPAPAEQRVDRGVRRDERGLDGVDREAREGDGTRKRLAPRHGSLEGTGWRVCVKKCHAVGVASLGGADPHGAPVRRTPGQKVAF